MSGFRSNHNLQFTIGGDFPSALQKRLLHEGERIIWIHDILIADCGLKHEDTGKSMRRLTEETKAVGRRNTDKQVEKKEMLVARKDEMGQQDGKRSSWRENGKKRMPSFSRPSP